MDEKIGWGKPCSGSDCDCDNSDTSPCDLCYDSGDPTGGGGRSPNSITLDLPAGFFTTPGGECTDLECTGYAGGSYVLDKNTPTCGGSGFSGCDWKFYTELFCSDEFPGHPNIYMEAWLEIESVLGVETGNVYLHTWVSNDICTTSATGRKQITAVGSPPHTFVDCSSPQSWSFSMVGGGHVDTPCQIDPTAGAVTVSW